mmetsp:Transcript_39659/g.89444  ORF Transcript_39659/g.89444 Transcript_39659/m.89444 type:complete len:311 (-) Transcript_39659:294-1226(-)
MVLAVLQSGEELDAGATGRGEFCLHVCPGLPVAPRHAVAQSVLVRERHLHVPVPLQTRTTGGGAAAPGDRALAAGRLIVLVPITLCQDGAPLCETALPAAGLRVRTIARTGRVFEAEDRRVCTLPGVLVGVVGLLEQVTLLVADGDTARKVVLLGHLHRLPEQARPGVLEIDSRALGVDPRPARPASHLRHQDGVVRGAVHVLVEELRHGVGRELREGLLGVARVESSLGEPGVHDQDTEDSDAKWFGGGHGLEGIRDLLHGRRCEVRQVLNAQCLAGLRGEHGIEGEAALAVRGVDGDRLRCRRQHPGS